MAISVSGCRANEMSEETVYASTYSLVKASDDLPHPREGTFLFRSATNCCRSAALSVVRV